VRVVSDGRLIPSSTPCALYHDTKIDVDLCIKQQRFNKLDTY